MDVVELAVLGRVLERLLTVVAAGVSLWIGGRLFANSAAKSDHAAEFSYKDFLVRLQRVGPGVFFAGFGAAILIYALSRPLETGPAPSETDGHYVNYYHDSDHVELDRWIAAATTAHDIAAIPVGQPIAQPDRLLLSDSTAALLEVRRVLLTLRFSEVEVAAWSRWEQEYRRNPQGVPESVRKTVGQISAVVDRPFMEYTR